MPIYLCSGSACRMRTVRSFFIFKQHALQTISVAEIIVAEDEIKALDIFWNGTMRKAMHGTRWAKQHKRAYEVHPEEVQKLLTEALLQPT